MHISYKDNSSLSQADTTTISIPANRPIVFVNKYGLGVGGAKAEEKYPLLTNGIACANSFASKGYETENTGPNKVGW